MFGLSVAQTASLIVFGLVVLGFVADTLWKWFGEDWYYRYLDATEMTHAEWLESIGVRPSQNRWF